MIRGCIVIFLALMPISGFSPLLQKPGFAASLVSPLI